MLRFFLILFVALVPALSFCQYNWKLEKDKDGIKVYTSNVAKSSFKAVKVECNFTGNYAKLIAVLSNVSKFKEWVFHNKSAVLLKQTSPHDLIYYAETSMPFPLSNRDVVIHLNIRTDSLPKFLLISGTTVSDMVPNIPTKVRVPKFASSWKITMPSATTLHIDYVVELDPGGSIPAWAVNMMAEKGPFGSFSKLGERLRQ
jgi:hypothetical protein